jgi:hypothetical protein
MFQLAKQEVEYLKPQIVTLKAGAALSILKELILNHHRAEGRRLCPTV